MLGVCWLNCVKVSRFHDFTGLLAQGSRALHARHMLCQAFPKMSVAACDGAIRVRVSGADDDCSMGRTRTRTYIHRLTSTVYISKHGA